MMMNKIYRVFVGKWYSELLTKRKAIRKAKECVNDGANDVFIECYANSHTLYYLNPSQYLSSVLDDDLVGVNWASSKEKFKVNDRIILANLKKEDMKRFRKDILFLTRDFLIPKNTATFKRIRMRLAVDCIILSLTLDKERINYATMSQCELAAFSETLKANINKIFKAGCSHWYKYIEVDYFLNEMVKN